MLTIFSAPSPDKERRQDLHRQPDGFKVGRHYSIELIVGVLKERANAPEDAGVVEEEIETT